LGGVWIGFDWLRIGTCGGLLWVRWWTFGFLCHELVSRPLHTCLFYTWIVTETMLCLLKCECCGARVQTQSPG
jgi:hypothetical protein